LGICRILLGTQGTSCFKPRGLPGSSPLRSDGSRDDQAGEAGLVEHSSAEAKSLKLRAKGLSGCHPNGQQPRQPDGEARGRIKDYSHDNSQKNTELKAALAGSTVRQKAKEERRLLYAPILKLQKGMVLGLMKLVMNESQNCQSQVRATTLWYLRFQPGK
jgi:hypothetical protein